MVKYFGIFFSLLSAFIALAQKPHVELIVQPTEVEVGEAFSVIVKSNISGEINIDFPPNYNQGYNVMNSMEQDFDGNTGEVITFYFHARTGSISKTGKYTFGPAFVRKGNKVYRSNKVIVNANPKEKEVNETVENTLFKKPACGSILLSKEKVYEGESLVIQAKVSAKFKPSHYDSYQSYSIQSGADQYKLANAQDIIVRNENIGNKERFVFELDKQVVFFNSPGKFAIDPFEMTLQSGFDGFQIHSKKSAVRVVPLPNNAPKSFIGGVGEFTVKSSFDKSNLKQGDITTLSVEISGKGNLHDITNPKLNLPAELKLYGDPERNEKFSFTEKGAEGYIQIQYHLQVVKAGEINFSPIPMAYFDPNKEKYFTKYTLPTKLTIEKDPSYVIAANNSVTSENKIERYNTENSADKSVFTSPIFKWIGISTPLCLALLFLVFRARKSKEEKIITTESQKISVEKKDYQEWISSLQLYTTNGNTQHFFAQLSKNLQQAISQSVKGDIHWVLSKDEITNYFHQKNLTNDLKSDFFSLQETCEQCRYGCQEPNETLDFYLDKAKNIFVQLDGL